MNRPTILFIEGLNTRTQPNVYWGPLNLGPSDHYWRQFATSHDYLFENFSPLGYADLETYAHRATKKFIENTSSNSPLHVLGHSMGGILALAVAVLLQRSGRTVISCTGMGTPFEGATMAKAALRLHETHPAVYNFMKAFGYDTSAKLSFYENLLPETVKQFRTRYKEIAPVRYGSIIGRVDYKNLPFGFQALHRLAKLDSNTDGMVECVSQKNGTFFLETSLDHFSQLGYVTHINPILRQRLKNEFKRTQNELLQYFHQVETKNSEMHI